MKRVVSCLLVLLHDSSLLESLCKGSKQMCSDEIEFYFIFSHATWDLGVFGWRAGEGGEPFVCWAGFSFMNFGGKIFLCFGCSSSSLPKIHKL
jgi:hypothetical protein